MIDEHADWIARGDRLFAALVGRVSELGLVSAYHSWTRESFGAESAMTHFHRRKDDRGFHIDFCLFPTAWRNDIREVVVGDPRRWLELSDHMPALVDLGRSDRAVQPP